MNILIVYANPDEQAFIHTVLESFTAGLKSSGHSVEVIDLYSIGFNPSLTRSELNGNQVQEDVLAHQQKVFSSNALVFISPVWWYGFPTIMRGWIDRVFSYGFAYTDSDDPIGTKGLLKHKKVLIIQTVEESKNDISRSGALNALERINIANFTELCGIPVVEHHFFYEVHMLNEEQQMKDIENAYSIGEKFDDNLDW